MSESVEHFSSTVSSLPRAALLVVATSFLVSFLLSGLQAVVNSFIPAPTMPRIVALLFLFLQLVAFGRSDLMRTVYCANKCNDYLKVPEASIPQCEDRHLKLNQCGTVISCSWADVELEKQRPVANSTDEIICCYNVVLKEKGDCDVQQAVPSSSQHTPRINNSTDCLTQTPALFTVIAVLVLVVAAQSFYIMWTCAFQRRLYHQKVCQLEESVTHSQGPVFASRPICESRLLSFENLPN